MDDIQDLVDTAALLTEQRLPAGPRLGIVGNAGGLGIIAADVAHRLGLEVPEISSPTRAELAMAAPGMAGASNPVDLGAGVSSGSAGSAVRVLMSSGEIDSLLVVVAATAVTDLGAVSDAIEATASEYPNIPCLTVLAGADTDNKPSPSSPANVSHPERSTRFFSSEAAVRALTHAVEYAAWRRSADAAPLSDADRPGNGRVEPTSLVPAEFCAPSTTNGRWLSPAAADTLLNAIGVRTTRWCEIRSEGDAVNATRSLRYPLVVKTGDPTIVHKTDDELVRTHLTSRRSVLAALRSIQRTTGPDSPVLVQEQLTGPELAVGIVRDPRFGPLVMVSSGGVALDLWGDQRFLMPPVSKTEIADTLRSLRTWPLLSGFRGSRRLDTAAVEELIGAVAGLAIDRPDILELDLNPVIVTSDAPVCVDAKIRVAQ